MRAVLLRELKRIARRPIEPLLLGVLPALALALAWTIFSAGTPRELPLAVVDLDHSRLSRQLVRMVDATPAIRVAAREADAEQAKNLVLSGEAYGWLLVPEGFELGVKRGERTPVVAYTNAQRLVAASLVRRDLAAATATLSAGVELRRLRAAGETRESAAVRFEPVRADVHALYNPQLHYGSYVVLALFPTLLHVFVLLAAVNAVGSELREGTAGEWLAAAGGSLARALVGKLLPATVSLFTIGAASGCFLFAGIGVPHRGSLTLLAVATLLLVVAYQALGLLLVAVSANLRFATSMAAFVASPAFAYVGITFPALGMPAFARAWGSLLPLTHYLDLLLGVALKGSGPNVAARPLAVLAGVPLLLTALAWHRLQRVTREPWFWGRA